MDQVESEEVDVNLMQDVSSKEDDEVGSNAAESSSKPDDIISLLDEELSQTMEEDRDIILDPQEKAVEGEDRLDVPETGTMDTSNVMEWEDVEELSESHKENEEKQCGSNVDSSEECETSSVAVVIMDEEFPSHTEDSNTESNVLDKDTNAAKSSEGQELDKDELINPLANLGELQESDKELENPLANISEQEMTDKEGGPDVLEMTEMETSNTEKSDTAEISTSRAHGDSSSLEIQLDNSVASKEDSPEKGRNELSSKDVVEGGTEDGDKNRSRVDEGEDIVELPMEKQPAMIVDLANDDETDIASQRASPHHNNDNESSFLDDKSANSEGKRIKLRSLASLVDINGGEDTSGNPVVSVSHSDIPAIGEIVEHGVIIGSDEMDGLQLRISNVTGGEDCITGLTVDEDRDSFSSIQISSVTTLIDPMSPEDPSKVNDKSVNQKGDENEKQSEGDGKTVDSSTRPEVGGGDVSVVVSSKDDGKSSLEESPSQSAGKSSEDKDNKAADEKDPESTESATSKVRHSSAASVSTLFNYYTETTVLFPNFKKTKVLVSKMFHLRPCVKQHIVS